MSFFSCSIQTRDHNDQGSLFLPLTRTSLLSSMAPVRLPAFAANNSTTTLTADAGSPSPLNVETTLAVTFGVTTLISSIISVMLAFMQLRRMR